MMRLTKQVPHHPALQSPSITIARDAITAIRIILVNDLPTPHHTLPLPPSKIVIKKWCAKARFVPGVEYRRASSISRPYASRLKTRNKHCIKSRLSRRRSSHERYQRLHVVWDGPRILPGQSLVCHIGPGTPHATVQGTVSRITRPVGI
jgi:hypothetical protein